VFAVRRFNSELMLVFIDESGDPEFKLTKGSSATFVAVLVAFRDDRTAAATQQAIENLAVRLKIHGEFKFAKTRAALRDEFLLH
jgi:hypothetical protein